MNSVRTKFLAVLDEFSLSGGVLVALSGGADSVCLLDLFLNSGFEYPVMAAHLNHNLRGEESDRDESFCRELCEKRGVKLIVGGADVNAVAKASGKGIEEAARSARYEFLQRALSEHSELSYIATAHNKGDFCETVVLNLTRGAGLDGMCSIPERRGNIIRPILKISRAEILEYNKANSLPFVTDSTNLYPDYSRNRVRLCILPEFEKLCGGYADNIERTASLLRRDADYLNGEARKLYGDIVQNGILYTKKAQNIHFSMLSRILRMLYNYYGFVDLTEAHIDALCELIRIGNENFTLSLHGCFAFCERGELTFKKELPRADEFCLPIEIGKETVLPSGMTVLLSRDRADGAYPLRADALCGKLTVRSRHDGDTVTVFGKTHKIKRMISDKKLCAKEKAKLFFLCADGEIIYSNIPATADKAFARRGDDCIFITAKDVN